MLVDDITRHTAREELFAAIANEGFPCVGAKSALARGSLKVIVGHSIQSAWDDVRIHSELLEWASAYRRDPAGLRSLAVVFDGPDDLDEEQFEAAMWERLQSLADKDEWRGQDYDPRVSPDPADTHFSLSFGGEGFFVVGLHPSASRPARRVARPDTGVQPARPVPAPAQRGTLRADARCDPHSRQGAWRATSTPCSLASAKPAKRGNIQAGW